MGEFACCEMGSFYLVSMRNAITIFALVLALQKNVDYIPLYHGRRKNIKHYGSKLITISSLDVLSEGRAIAGLGIGWSKDEYEVSNIPFQNRGKRADEFIQVLKRIWTDDVVEFNGKYYSIPASKIGPKPIQKPNIPIYLGGFSPNTSLRIVNYDTNGWLAVVGGPLEYLDNTIKTMKDIVNKANKDPSKFKVILLAHLNVALDSKSQSTSSSTNEGQRFPFTGTIDQIGNDIKRIKQMDIDHLVFGYNFIPIGGNVDKMLDITKQLAKFAR